MDYMDWEAAISSEVFRNYVSTQLQKEAEAIQTPEEKLDEEIALMKDFEDFERKVNESPRLKASFQKLQDTFIHDAEYTAKVNPKFVDAVMMLKLADEELEVELGEEE
jgi:hypothetical protein